MSALARAPAPGGTTRRALLALVLLATTLAAARAGAPEGPGEKVPLPPPPAAPRAPGQGPLCKCHDTVTGLQNLACANTTQTNTCRVEENFVIKCKPLSASCSCACSTDLDLEFGESSSVTCDSVVASRCLLGWKVGGNVTLYPGALIQASTFWLRAAGRVDIMASSAINTTGLGLAFRSRARQTMTGYGGSNGGRGGLSACSRPPDLASPLLGNPIAPWTGWAEFRGTEVIPRAASDEGYGFGGSVLTLAGLSSPSTRHTGRGGGRVYVESGDRVTIGGVILADGVPATSECLVDCGSGAGGTIVINATDFVGSGTAGVKAGTSDPYKSALSAIGGNAYRDSAGAGGGGRISISTMRSLRRENFDVRAFGGLSKAATVSTLLRDAAPRALATSGQLALRDTSNCRGGAAGTIATLVFLEKVKTFDASLQISNCPASGTCTAPDFALASTPLAYPVRAGATVRVRSYPVLFTALQINKYAQVNASSLEFDRIPEAARFKNGGFERSDTGILINSGRLTSVQYLETASLQLNSGSSLRVTSGGEVVITDGDLSLDSSSGFVFSGPIRVDVAGSFVLDGTLQAQDGALGTGLLPELDELASSRTGLTSYFRAYASNINFHKGSSVVSDRIALLSNSSIVLSGKIRATYIPACAQIETRKTCKDFSNTTFAMQTTASRRETLRAADTFYANYSLAVLVFSGISTAPAAPAPTPPPRPPPRPRPPGEKNMTIINNIVVDLPAEVTARSMLVCAPTIRVQGRVSGTGQGCLADSGPGAGCTSSASAGGGGGHGGLGGPGVGCSAPGRTYDSEDFPILSGSGGGSGLSGIGGGTGGGVIMVGATMTLRLEGEISSDGSSGSGQDSKRRSAGGGGSGGSIRIDAPSICALNTSPGRISARGGMGGAGGGGGGGGGRIAINFADEFSGDGVIFVGPLPTSPPFPAPSKMPDGRHALTPIPPPSSSDVSCTHFGNFSIPIYVDGGAQGGEAPSLRSNAANRSLGFGYRSRSGFEGTVASPMCSLGHGGSWCAVCPYGFYKDEEGPEPCRRCEHKSCITLQTCEWLAEGSSHPDCPVLCNAGYVLPNCVTPLENLIDSMGGIVVFATVLASFGLTLVIVFTCVCTRVEWCPGYYANMAKMLQKREQSRRGLMQHRREMGFDGIAEDGSPLDASLLHGDDGGVAGGDGNFVALSTANSRLQARSPSLRSGLKGGSLRSQGLLVEADVRSHLKRIYLAGNNSTSEPWVFPSQLPAELSDAGLFDAEAFAEMAVEVNKLARHSAPTWLISALLHILCYPLGYLYMKKQRQVRANKLVEFFADYDHKCVLNARARALMNSFKFGSDAKCTVGYVDVLASKPLNAAARQRRLPMLLFLAGDGSYWAPFGVDLADVLVLAVPQIVELRSFIDEPWFQLLDELNSALRKVDMQSIATTSQPALRVLGRYNADPDRLGGLRVRLGLFATPNCPRGSSRHRDRRLALLLSLDEELAQQSLRAHERSQRRDWADAHQHHRSLPDHLTDDQYSEAAAHHEAASASHTEDRSTATAPPPAKVLGDHQSHIGTPSGGSYFGAVLTSEEHRAAQAAVQEFEELERQQAQQQAISESLAGGESTLAMDGSSGSMPGTPTQQTPPLPSLSAGAATTDIASVLESPGRGPAPRHESDRFSIASARSREDTHAGLEALAGLGRSAQRDPAMRSASGGADNASIAAESGIPWEAQDLIESARNTSSIEDVFREDLPAPGEILTRKHPEDSELDEDDDFDCMPCNVRIYSLLPTLQHKLGILQNRRPRRKNHQSFFRSFLSALLLADAVCTFFLLTSFLCVERVRGSCNRTPLILAMSIYPLALGVAPLCGLTFVVFPLSGMGRHYAVWNALALINTLVSCVLAIAYLDKVSLEAGLLAALLLAIKLMQSRVVDFYIALIETDSSFNK